MAKKSAVRMVALAVLVILTGVLMLSCGNDNPAKSQQSADSKVFTSSAVLGHSHRITIQKSEIETPPTGGISRETTSDSAHTHTFVMSETELTNAKTGPVAVTTGDTGGHTHDFTIQKWY